jgi:hypothetical protein
VRVLVRERNRVSQAISYCKAQVFFFYLCTDINRFKVLKDGGIFNLCVCVCVCVFIVYARIREYASDCV